MDQKIIKERLIKLIFNNLSSIPNVLSVTLVGSFIDRKDLIGISDIDTIVVCDSLNHQIYNECVKKIQLIKAESVGLDGYQFKINTSFGPLKFDEPKLGVIHLMIYDLDGHQFHTLASPFTCFDWERSSAYIGKRLKDIFPVGNLQPRDFLEARRGVENYLDDLRSNTISTRDYSFRDESVSEIQSTHPLDSRHQGEYAYHIVRNLVLNALKLHTMENRLFSQEEMENWVLEFLGNDSQDHYNNFLCLAELKKKRSKHYPKWTLDWTSKFISDFQKYYVNTWECQQTIYFFRHAPTSMNDGSFLGQGRDPDILSSHLKTVPHKTIKTLYSSPAKRCIQTAKAVDPNAMIIPDQRLKEINYGLAEGLNFHQFKIMYPDNVDAWNAGGDPQFPGGGENTADVMERINSFCLELNNNADRTIGVITHNVVLRCLIGQSYSIPRILWHRLVIPHAEPMEFKIRDKKIYGNLPRVQLGQIFKELNEYD